MAASRNLTPADTSEFVRAFTLFDAGRHAGGTIVLAWVDDHAQLMLREPVCTGTGRSGGELYTLPASTISSVQVFEHDEGQAVRIDASATGTGGFILVGQSAALRSLVDDLRMAAARLAAAEARSPRDRGLLRLIRRAF